MKRMIASCFLVVCGAMLTAADKDAKDAIRKLDGVKLMKAKPDNKPTQLVFKSTEDVEKFTKDEDTLKAIKAKVDFTKEVVVVFHWQGSGGDRINGAMSADGKEALFNYTVGLTFDLREHILVFVAPKEAKLTLKQSP
jgi:hypothetical protein